ncbi:MAG: hypothetical protein KDC49_20115 [Saprospiraceae bacterium]|nr:hypothetical protein [Saprospiraceae bacterium]
MKTLVKILSIIILTGCNKYPAKHLIKVPSINYSHDQSILKTNGYYRFKYVSEGGNCYINYGSKPQTKKVFYNIKQIKTIVLYNNGAAYHSGRNGYSNAINYEDCIFLDSLNTYEQLEANFENRAIKSGLNLEEDYGWYDTGVFSINKDEITIQIFHGAGWVQAGSSVLEYRGQIVNNQLIRIKQIKNLEDDSIDFVNMDFEFKEFDGIQPVNNYILRNREKFGMK